MKKDSKYIYSLFPFSENIIVVTIAIFSIALFIILHTILKNHPRIDAIFLFSLIFLVLVVVVPAQILFLHSKSPFEKENTLIKAKNFPFFVRLLVYSNGIEIKRLFTSYFIPYEFLLPVREYSEKAFCFEFSSFNLKLESTNPDIPTIIARPRLYPYIMDTINEQREKYLAEHASKPERG